MNITPINDGILIEEITSTEDVKDVGGIFVQVVDTFKDKNATVFRGVVISKGLGKYDDDGKRIENALLDDIKIGDIVLCKPSGGTYITGRNGKKYKIENIEDIVAKE